jgi:hypothetical protein
MMDLEHHLAIGIRIDVAFETLTTDPPTVVVGGSKVQAIPAPVSRGWM